jgi:F-type H+-transporting ATPase subunit b
MMAQFDFTTYLSQIFWTLLTFGSFTILLSSLILTKVAIKLDSRAKHIKDSLDFSTMALQEISIIKQQIADLHSSLAVTIFQMEKGGALKVKKLLSQSAAKTNMKIEKLAAQQTAILDKIIAQTKQDAIQSVVVGADLIYKKFSNDSNFLPSSNQIN